MKRRIFWFLTLAALLVLEGACSLMNETGKNDGSDVSLNGKSSVVKMKGYKTGVKLPSQQELLRMKKGMRTIINVYPNQIRQSRLSGLDTPRSIQFSKTGAVSEYDTIPSLEYSGISGSKAITKAVTALPKQVNNALLNAFPPIGDQGGIGSCAAFSTTYYTMTHEVGLKYGINNHGGVGSSGNKIFTPKWTYNLINGGGDWGSWMTSINELMMQVGCATWDEFPYNGDGGNPVNYLEWCLNTNTWMNAMKDRVSGQGSVPVTESLSEIKGYLANGHVVTFATGVFSWHYMTIGNNSNSSLDDAYSGKNAMVYMDAQNAGGHSMTVVGYNDDVWVDINGDGQVQTAELGVFIIANSWSQYFEDNGFTYMAYDSIRQQSIAGLTNQDRTPALWNNEFYYIEVQQYAPTYVASFTLNQEQRYQINVNYSNDTSGELFNTPFRYTGGAYSFAGNNTSCDGTFLLDVSSFMSTTNSKVYLNISDGFSGNPTQVKDCSIIDLAAQKTYKNQSLPQTIDSFQGVYELSLSGNEITNVPASIMIDDFNSSAQWNAKLNDLNQPIVCNSGLYNLEGDQNIYFFYNGGVAPESFDTYLNCDISSCRNLVLKIKGGQGGEENTLKVILNDGSNHPVSVSSYGTITTSYKEISIPLTAFGANLANARCIRIEGTGYAKVIRIDEIKLDGSSAPQQNFGCTKIGTDSVKFYFNPETSSGFVDVHYIINGLQSNYRMNKISEQRWEFTASGIHTGDSLRYFFTYEKSGLAYDTVWQEFIF